MTHDDEPGERRIHLFCKKTDSAYTVMVGPGWLHPRLAPLFDAQFESDEVLLDFEHLEQSLARVDAQCEVKESHYGSKELIAQGKSAAAVAKWLSSAMASGVVKR